MVQHWQVPFLGLQETPPELTDFEIRYFFTFTAKEREAIFSRYGDHHRLAVALQIGMIKMTGRTLALQRRLYWTWEPCLSTLLVYPQQRSKSCGCYQHAKRKATGLLARVPGITTIQAKMR